MKRDTRYGLCMSLGIHTLALYGFGAAFIQGPEFSMDIGGNNIEVDLVAAPAPLTPAPMVALKLPEPEIKKEEIPPPPKPDDMVSPVTEEVKEIAYQPAPPSAAPPILTSATGTGDGSSPIAGNDATTMVSDGGGLTEAKPGYLKNPAPVYPERARQMGQEGQVVLRVSVTADGLPEQIDIRQSSGFPMLDGAAVKTLRRWKFRPARIGGITVAAEVDVPIRFKLN